MNKKFILITVMLFSAAVHCQINQNRPNIVIIYTDDQNYEHIGSFGGNVYTPHQDALATEGIKFTQAFATASICTPSRYGLMTGRFPSRSTSKSFTTKFPEGTQTEVGFNTHLDPSKNNLASVLRKAGYKTGIVGKWDFGTPGKSKEGAPFFISLPQKNNSLGAWIQDDGQADPKSKAVSALLKTNHQRLQDYSKKIGFDYAEGLYNLNPEMWRNHALNIHNMEWVADGALKFIDRYKNEPFFLYMAPTLMHIPHPQESMLNADPRISMEGYLPKAPAVMPARNGIIKRVQDAGYPAESAYCTWLDDAIGAVVNRLKDLDLYENTAIILMSDHQTHAKTSLYEGGVKTPLIIHYPKKIKSNNTSTQLVQNIDIAPTVLDLCKVEKPQNMHIDGKSLLPMLTGEVESVHNELFFEYGWTRAVRTKDWKYIALRYSKSAVELRKIRGRLYHNIALEPMQHEVLLSHPNYWDADQLYDLSTDKGETTNLANIEGQKERTDEMKAKLKNWLKTFGNHPFGEFNP